MNREGTIGAAALLAIAAWVGLSVQSAPKTPQGSAVAGEKSKPPLVKPKTPKDAPGCSSLRDELQGFLEIDGLVLPASCYEGEAPPTVYRPELIGKISELKYVIATLPDPIHTHLPVIFDQLSVAIQEGAQDEKYDFDSAWLPWDLEDTTYTRLDDEKKANEETGLKEDQPGIILFRRSDGPLTENYGKGLVVFVVGEEPTQGIHKAQFRNALAWVQALQPPGSPHAKVGILGPTFSGSLPSLAQLFSEPEISVQLNLEHPQASQRLGMFSGSVSSDTLATSFRKTFGSRVVFHSFVESDTEILRRFCRYITHEMDFKSERVAIISEDETAYGSYGATDPSDCLAHALRLYYPRDISALRGAYQDTSLFSAGTSGQQSDAQRRTLPSDLADPAGKVHDSIRSYGGTQTPLNQEAFLIEIVAALQELHARYIILRSSNTLDQVFLTNFLRRNYADGRIVILNSDLMFIRERGTTGMSGVMTLSTYPLFPLERDWTEHQSLGVSDRVFGANASEGAYIALRLLLNEPSLNGGLIPRKQCHVKRDPGQENASIFVPPVACSQEVPIPDYSPPFWTLQGQCGEIAPNTDGTPDDASLGDKCPFPGPAIWLSVIGKNRNWPMAALMKDTPRQAARDPKSQWGKKRNTDPLGRPNMPLGMKVGWLSLIAFSIFHLWCCASASYTAKPAFLAYFASTGGIRHAVLIFFGSGLVAFSGIVAGWGCGVFASSPGGLQYPYFALWAMLYVCGLGWLAVLANNRRIRTLRKDRPSDQNLHAPGDDPFIPSELMASAYFLLTVFMFYAGVVTYVEMQLTVENRVLTYWRSMHLTSGVSPVVPIATVLVGLYTAFWFTLHGLALFGPDKPRLPLQRSLDLANIGKEKAEFLKMFSEEDAAVGIEKAATPLCGKILSRGAGFYIVALSVSCAVAQGTPVRSLGSERYAQVFLAFLVFCCTLALVEVWRFCAVWRELRRLLEFLDRVPLRRAMSSLRGFSWDNVWKMSGNVLEVRYKVISRQIECMNHTIQSLEDWINKSLAHPGANESLVALQNMQGEVKGFAAWYAANYTKVLAGDLTSFEKFQASIALASGTLFSKLLVPEWTKEQCSLLAAVPGSKEDSDRAVLPPAKEPYVRNAEEFVCLNYLSFVQNVLGRMRTMAMAIVALFLAATIATSTYPFDPRQGLSAVLIVLFIISGGVIVKVYAEMHRDDTLSHVTNTKPGELGLEFWFKIIGFGFAPLATLLTRILPGITDFVFSWLQPGVASLK